MSAANLFYWLMPWEPSLTVIAATISTVFCYISGAKIHPPTFRQSLCFWLGLILIYTALHTGYDYYSEHEFFMHRIQHTVLHHLAPFLIILSRPGAALAAGMPKILRQKISLALRWQPVIIILNILNNPLIASIIFCGLILFWLIPPIHFIAMLDWRLYRLMNWGMLINGLMFWSLALNNYCLKPAKLSATTRIAMMLAIIPPQIAIGALIFLAPRELYPLYTICGRAFGISALADQQIGGLILWIPAAMMSVIGILVIIKREWLVSPPA